MMARPLNIDTSDWGPFDPKNVTDAMCERERQAFTAYVLKRVQKQPKTGSDDTAIVVGGFMSIVQLVYANDAGCDPDDSVREQLHSLIDHIWLMVGGMAAAQRKPN